jgi:hypothetical protein
VEVVVVVVMVVVVMVMMVVVVVVVVVTNRFSRSIHTYLRKVLHFFDTFFTQLQRTSAWHFGGQRM